MAQQDFCTHNTLDLYIRYMPDPNPDESDDGSAEGYEVTVKKGEHGERVEVIDVEDEDLKEAERKALNRDDVFEIVDGCTVGYETKENGARVY